MTARDIIIATLRSIRVLGVGDPLSADDANDAFDRLNDWLDALALERLTMAVVLRTEKRLANDVPSYSIGVGGDIGIVRPTTIESANLIYNPDEPLPYEKPMDVWTDQRWQGCRQKTLTSPYPTAIYYDHAWKEGLGRIYLWPIPTDCGKTKLVIYTPEALKEFATLDTDYTFPPGYRRFIRSNFAAEIASEYGKQLTTDQVQIAKQSKAQIKRGNVRPGELRVDAALIRGYDFFDWRSGETKGEWLTMALISVLIVLIVVGVLLWLVETQLPMAAPFKVLIRVVVILAVVIWLVQLLLGPLPFPRLR